ncbi:hypothetical protein L5515_018003 [Caenorhabditis briggsae]|uniref:Uncharacterized protein n=1 Tax=Caenorhabditis briggsae TaxID=6238 RepID=A0AAE9JS20_CAEBR|nr:hypothetical protein L5515_018003 [Caenorhabditis briggsae]
METLRAAMEQETNAAALKKIQVYNFYVVKSIEFGLLISYVLFLATLGQYCPYMYKLNLSAGGFVIFNIIMAWILKRMKREYCSLQVFLLLVHLFWMVYCFLHGLSMLTTTTCSMEDYYLDVRESATGAAKFDESIAMIGIGAQAIFGFTLRIQLHRFCGHFKASFVPVQGVIESTDTDSENECPAVKRENPAVKKGE